MRCPILLLTFLSLLSPLCLAQDKEAKKQAKEEANQAKQVAKYKQQFKTSYDKFKDLSRFRTGYMPLANTNGREVYTDATHFGVAIECAGEKVPCASPRPALYFAARSKDWRFIQNYSLIALADGERLVFEHVSRGGEVDKGSGVYSSVSVIEYILADMSQEQLSKMASAKDVEFQLGSYEYKLTPAEITVLGEAVKMLKP